MADQAGQGAGPDREVATLGGRVNCDDEAGRGGVEADLGERRGLLLRRHPGDGDRRTDELGDRGSHVLLRPGDVARELVDVVELGDRRGEDDGSRLRVVGAGGAGDAALVDAREDGAGMPRRADGGRVVLVVPAVAQQRRGDADRREVGLGVAVVRGDGQRGGLRTNDADVGEVADVGRDGGVDGGGVLLGALPDVAARDQEQPVDSGEGVLQRSSRAPTTRRPSCPVATVTVCF